MATLGSLTVFNVKCQDHIKEEKLRIKGLILVWDLMLNRVRAEIQSQECVRQADQEP